MTLALFEAGNQGSCCLGDMGAHGADCSKLNSYKNGSRA